YCAVRNQGPIKIPYWRVNPQGSLGGAIPGHYHELMNQIGIRSVVDLFKRSWVSVIKGMASPPAGLHFVKGDDIASHCQAFHLRKTCPVEECGIIRLQIVQFSLIVIIQKID